MFGAIAGGVLGAIAGGQGTPGQNMMQQKIVAPESDYEKFATTLNQDQLKSLQGLVGAGAGQQDVEASLGSQRSLAQMLGQYQQGGYQPSEADRAQAQQYISSMFAPEQQQLQQRFQDMSMQSQQQRARMGRGPMDVVFQNKLMQEQTRQQADLGARQQQQFAQYAQSIPQQRLQYAQQLAQVQGGLASQAMSNRQMLFGMGQQVKQSEQNFRAGTASTMTSTPGQGGGFLGALTGALGGIGKGAGMQAGFNEIGSGISSMWSKFGREKTGEAEKGAGTSINMTGGSSGEMLAAYGGFAPDPEEVDMQSLANNGGQQPGSWADIAATGGLPQQQQQQQQPGGTLVAAGGAPSAWDNIISNLKTGAAAPKANPTWDSGTVADSMAKTRRPIRKAQGGFVPGTPKVPHNDYANDIVPAKLTPGELVIPISEMGNLQKAQAYVANMFASKGR